MGKPRVGVVRNWWTSERLALAKEVLGRHGTVIAACVEFSREVERGVTPFSLAHAFQKAGMQRPSAFLQRGFAAVDELPIDVSAFEETMPEGQRLKGNSTLLDASGKVDRKWVKTERDSLDPPDVERVPPGFTIEGISTNVDGQGFVRQQWTRANKEKADQWHEFWEACAAATERYKGLAEPVPAPADVLDRMMVLYPLGDPHIGMLSWAPETGAHFDLKICERDLVRVVDMLVERAPAAQRAVLINVGDMFHSENEAQLTPTGGNKLDVDGRRAKVVELGFVIVRRLIDLLLRKHAEVTMHNVPGNHDPTMATMIALWCRAVYEREPRVTIADANNPYQYIRFGKNLVGIAHGDGAKMEALPEIMACDRPEDWGRTLYRTWITGHVHHKRAFESRGCTMESFRTLATRDAWHNAKGYRSGQSLSCITLDEEYGEIMRATVDLRLGRAR